MPINSKKKGGRGEREWCQWLRENLKIEARRGQQFRGTPDSPDVISDLEHIHWEVKRVERLNIDQAIDQAASDADQNQVPVVAHRKNHKPWLITIKADDLIRFHDELNLHFVALKIEEFNDVQAT